jgi:hypothetical protein
VANACIGPRAGGARCRASRLPGVERCVSHASTAERASAAVVREAERIVREALPAAQAAAQAARPGQRRTIGRGILAGARRGCRGGGRIW